MALQLSLKCVLTYLGFELFFGVHLHPDKGAGWFIEPTCFVDVTPEMRIACEEIFGPVLVVLPYEDEEDAIRIANNSEYSLSGGILTGDLASCQSYPYRHY